MKQAEKQYLEIGQLVGYFTVCDEMRIAQLSYLYDGDKSHMAQIFIPELKQYFDYPINEMLVGDR
jgi:hypothetical protein